MHYGQNGRRALKRLLYFFYPTIQLSKIKNYHSDMATVRGLDAAIVLKKPLCKVTKVTGALSA